MADIELRAFEARLDAMMDQLSEESTELIVERPRYAHAVMVFASGDEPGELLTASRIKMLDPIYDPVETSTNGHQVLHHYSENKIVASAESAGDLDNCGENEDLNLNAAMKIYDDDDIQKALRKLEESRSMLDKPIIPLPINKLPSGDSKLDCANKSGTAHSKMFQPAAAQFSVSPICSRSISERYTALKEDNVLFQERRAPASSARIL